VYIVELSDRWMKAYTRFTVLENRTNTGLAAVHGFKAQIISFQAVHERVNDVYKDVELKVRQLNL